MSPITLDIAIHLAKIALIFFVVLTLAAISAILTFAVIPFEGRWEVLRGLDPEGEGVRICRG